MTATLRVSGLSASHGERTLFSGLDLVLSPGDVVGLIGANGSGKSTLLGLLAGAGRTPVDGDATGEAGVAVEGTILLIPTDATVGIWPRRRSAYPARRCWTSWYAGLVSRRRSGR